MKQNNKILRINKKLPQIILPRNKIDCFLEWYDKDLRFQNDIPSSFERGYLFIEGTLFSEEQLQEESYKKIFRTLAKIHKTTYRTIEDFFKDYINKIKNTVIYFEFEKPFLKFDMYLQDELYCNITIDLSKIDESEPNPTLSEIQKELYENGKNFQDLYGHYCLILLECSLWYIATTTKTTKYYRENKSPAYVYEKKEVINVKRNRTISTPIYDMSKIKRVKVEGLIKRRKGWTYSHSFQVHGHYRHYKDGKVIFIKPFIKGKGKEIAQRITLNPKEN